MYDAETGCQVCFVKEAENYNPIMFCNGCNSGVHARCFGNGHIDDIDKMWYCDTCKRKRPIFNL